MYNVQYTSDDDYQVQQLLSTIDNPLYLSGFGSSFLFQIEAPENIGSHFLP